MTNDLTESCILQVLDQWIGEASEAQATSRTNARQRFLDFFNSTEESILLLHRLRLTSLPNIFDLEPFQSRLIILHLWENQLTDLPESLFNLPSLKELRLNDNQLTGLPESSFNLPALTVLDLRKNQLTDLPESFFNLPALKRLFLSNNQLANLSESFSSLQALIRLELGGNPTLSGIPRQILSLSPNCTVDLTGCNLSQDVLGRLRETRNSPNYQGPRISFSISDRTHLNEEKSIKESLKDLFSIVDEAPIDFPELGQRAELRSWLNRLSDIADYKRAGEPQKIFVKKIIEYLKLANENKGFREIFYNIIQDASETCGDRVALSVLNLGIAHRLATIDLKDTKALAGFLIKGPWTIEMLTEIARNKIPSLPYFDEVEVYLGYPIKLKEELEIPIDVQEMLYFSFSALKHQDLKEAKDFVLKKRIHEENYLEFLIENDTWKKALSTNYREEYQAILDKRDKASLQSVNPDDDADIQAQFKQELTKLTKKALM